MGLLVDACYLLAAAVLAPIVLYRSITTGKYRRDWDQRRGWLPEMFAGRPRVWLHAVSMGEVNSIQGIVAAWRRRSPETEFVISCTTGTGIDRARRLFPDLTVFRYPLDLSWFVARALDRIKPTMVVLVELEVWYQFLELAETRGIPVVVVNGRLTESKSLRRFRWIMPVARRMFSRLAWVGAQDEVYADRFRQLGVPGDCVTVTGSMMWDTAEITDAIPGSDMLARAMGLDPDRPTWVCGSTAPGEEPVILKAYESLCRRHPKLQLVIVPRKPERFDEVAAAIRQAGFDCVRRSESPDGTERPPSETAVLLGDTMGELRKFYTLADVVFVGRTLADMGGSDMMEVAGLARPIVVGPHTHNFTDTVRQLQAGDAVRVVSADLENPAAADALARAVAELLDDPGTARRLADNGRDVVKRNRGATQRTLDSLMEILDRAQHRAS